MFMSGLKTLSVIVSSNFQLAHMNLRRTLLAITLQHISPTFPAAPGAHIPVFRIPYSPSRVLGFPVPGKPNRILRQAPDRNREPDPDQDNAESNTKSINLHAAWPPATDSRQSPMASAFVSTLGEMPWRAATKLLDVLKNFRQQILSRALSTAKF